MKRDRVRLFLLFAMVSVLIGCAARVDGLVHDKSFDYHAAVGGRLALVGVVSSVEPLSAAERSRHSELFRREILAEHKQYEVVSAGQVARKLGLHYTTMLDGYRDTATLADDDFARLQAANLKARYLVLARIDQNAVSQDRSENRQQRYDKKGKPNGEVVTVAYNTQRAVATLVTIYDVKTRQSVWSGSVAQQQSNSNRREREVANDINDILLEALIDAAFGDQALEQRYPTAPAFDRVLRSTFSGVAENLPKID